MRRQRRIPEWKIREVEELRSLIKRYKVIGIADLTGLPSAQLQLIRKKLRGKALIRVAKNTLMRRAIEGIDGLKGKEKLIELLKGQNAFVFTDMNPFELNMLLEKYKMATYAKPGDIAPKDIVIPAGNTGIMPGPILSVFGRLRIPTRVQEGTIWVVKDVVAAKQGDVISADLASLLQKLDIAPIEVGLRLKAVFCDGMVIPDEQLKIDLEEYKSMVATAYRNALGLAVEAAIPVPEAIRFTVMKAVMQAIALAAEACIVTPETAKYVLAKAQAMALALASRIAPMAPELGLSVVQPPEKPPSEEVAEERVEEAAEEVEEEREELGEEELAAGLEALFG